MFERVVSSKTMVNKSLTSSGAVFAIMVWLCCASALQGQEPATNELRKVNESVQALIKKVSPSVVQILVTGFGAVEETEHGNTGLVIHGGTEVPLETGDVIRSLNGEPMKTLYQLRDALAKLPPRSSVALQIQRDDRLMFITFTTELWRVSQEWPAVGAWWLVSSIAPFEAQGRLYGARNPFWIAVPALAGWAKL